MAAPTTDPWRIGWLFASMSGCPFVESRPWISTDEAVVGTAIWSRRRRPAASLVTVAATAALAMGVPDCVGAAFGDPREQRLGAKRAPDGGVGAEARPLAPRQSWPGRYRANGAQERRRQALSAVPSRTDFCTLVEILVRVVILKRATARPRASVEGNAAEHLFDAAEDEVPTTKDDLEPRARGVSRGPTAADR